MKARTVVISFEIETDLGVPKIKNFIKCLDLWEFGEDKTPKPSNIEVNVITGTKPKAKAKSQSRKRARKSE